jgi:hypothetical protein
MNTMITLLPIIVALTVLYAIAWHDQPARNPERERPTDPPRPPM